MPLPLILGAVVTVILAALGISIIRWGVYTRVGGPAGVQVGTGPPDATGDTGLAGLGSGGLVLAALAGLALLILRD